MKNEMINPFKSLDAVRGSNTRKSKRYTNDDKITIGGITMKVKTSAYKTRKETSGAAKVMKDRVKYEK